jgi:dihydroorotate dehydrogenase (fumarate)
MIDLSTEYLGLKLKSPLVASSSPLTGEVGGLCALEDAGAAAVVLPSLFEEQLRLESMDLDRWLSHGAESFAEAVDYFPDMVTYNLGPAGYLDLIRRAKRSVHVPVIASLNGVTPSGWVEHARAIQEAGADALELNVYEITTDPARVAVDVEIATAELVRKVKGSLHIPVAVKIGPFYSSLPAFARELEMAGADGLVLFNRFYQPEFDLETLEVVPYLRPSTPAELLLRLHAVAILYGKVRPDLAVTGGVHSGHDALKAMMAGARVAMLASALLEHGPSHLAAVHEEMAAWMDGHGYQSVREMRGSMSLRAVADPAAFERANYMKVLRSYALREAGAGG